jgi:hypothetical protein
LVKSGQNGLKWLKFVKNWLKIVKLVKNWSKWSKGLEWLKFVNNCLEMVENWSKIIENVPRTMSKFDQNYRQWSLKAVKNV